MSMAKFILTCFFSFVSIVVFALAAQAQSIGNDNLGVNTYGPDGADWYGVGLWNGDSSSVDFFTLSGIPMPTSKIHCEISEGWWCHKESVSGGTSTVTWFALPGWGGQPLQPGHGQVFLLHVPGAYRTVVGGWCAIGNNPVRCGPVPVPAD